jgi:hypothetical protein
MQGSLSRTCPACIHFLYGNVQCKGAHPARVVPAYTSCMVMFSARELIPHVSCLRTLLVWQCSVLGSSSRTCRACVHILCDSAQCKGAHPPVWYLRTLPVDNPECKASHPSCVVAAYSSMPSHFSVQLKHLVPNQICNFN